MNTHLLKEMLVFDNFFPNEKQLQIVDLLNRPRWSFTGGNNRLRFWHMDGLENEVFFNTDLFNIICEKLQKQFKVGRIYANGQTAGQSGFPHFDDGDFTFLYYPNMNWEALNGGGLVFLESDGTTIYKSAEIIGIIGYKPNRALLFPGKLAHYALEPERHYNDLRISLAWKLFNIE